MDHFSRVISTILLVKLVKKKKVKQTVLFISTSTAVVPNVFFFCLPYLKVRAKFHGSRSEAGIVHRACLLAVETMPGSFMSPGNLENRNSNWDQLRSFRTRSSADRSKGPIFRRRETNRSEVHLIQTPGFYRKHQTTHLQETTTGRIPAVFAAASRHARAPAPPPCACG